MGKYTVYANPEVDSHIENSLQLIVKKILNLIGRENIKAIILTGGFARGEGGVSINNKHIKPINDFDISIVIKFSKYKYIVKQYSKALEKIAQDTAKRVEIKQIDLGLSHPAKFLKMNTSVSSYEYQYGNRILFGRQKIQKKINPEKLSITDGTQYFLTRGSGLLISALSFMKTSNIDETNRENFLIETNKALLAIGDSYLLLKKRYHFSYKKRGEIAHRTVFNDICFGNVIKKKYIDAIKWKLKPEVYWTNDAEQIKSWFEIQNLFGKYFLWFENTRLNQNFQNWGEYCKQIVGLQSDFPKSSSQKVVRMFFNNPLFFINKKKYHQLRFNHFACKLSILPTILFSIDSSFELNYKLLNTGRLNLKKYYNIEVKNDWFDIADAYLQIFHPGGVVKRIIGERTND